MIRLPVPPIGMLKYAEALPPAYSNNVAPFVKVMPLVAIALP